MDRYQKVYALPERLYTTNSPILIEKGVLLKDTQTGNILVQLKFKNLSNKVIKALKVAVTANDVSNTPLQGVGEYQYLDLSVDYGEFFGATQAILLPDSNARTFNVKILCVIFADGSEWSTPNATWEPLAEQENLDTFLGDDPTERYQLITQYRRETTSRAEFVPLETEELWLCACGSVNCLENELCPLCYVTKATIFSALDKEQLTVNAKTYETNRNMRNARIKKTVIKATVAVLSAILVIWGIAQISHAVKYSKATKLAEEYKYAEAKIIFYKLDNYKDSAEQYRLCNNRAELEELYQEGISLLHSNKTKKYWLAEEKFEEIQAICDKKFALVEMEDYRDTENYLIYFDAVQEQQFGYLAEALELYNTLPEDFEDIQQRKEKIEPFAKFCGTWKKRGDGRTIDIRIAWDNEAEVPTLIRGGSSGYEYDYKDDGTFTMSYSQSRRNEESGELEAITQTETISISDDNLLTITYSDGSSATYSRLKA